MPLINFIMGLLAIVAAVFIYLEVVTVLVDLASPVVFTTELRSWNPFINPVLKVVMIIGIILWFKHTPRLWSDLTGKLHISYLRAFAINWLAPAIFGLLELIRLKKRIFG